MNLPCSRFTEEGMWAARTALQSLREGTLDELPEDLLSDPARVQVVGKPLPRPTQGFATRWQFAAWLYRELPQRLDAHISLSDPGLWTWLAFYFFQFVRPEDTKIGEDARYIFNGDDYRKRYRHLVAGPYFVFSAHHDQPHLIRGLLATHLHAPGEVYEQFASRQELVTSGAVMLAMTKMYLGADGLKRGAAASARRLADVLMQFDVTFDFVTLSSDRLLAMLPREFRKFIPSASAATAD